MIPLLAVAGPSPLWYLTRGTGLVALLLLTLSVTLGIATTSKAALPRSPRFVTVGLHRNVSLLVVVVLAVHIVTAEADTYAPVGWAAVVVPGISRYRPIWLGLGTLAFDLLLALVATSLVRRHLGRRLWRGVHWAAYLSWPAALVHGLGTGTDPRTGWMQALTVGCVAAVLAALAWRLGAVSSATPFNRGLAATGIAGVVALLALWTSSGPLRPGWSRRAGTPVALLHSATAPGAVAAAGPAAAGTTGGSTSESTTAAPTAGWTDTLTGRLSQHGPGATGTVSVTIAGTLTGGPPGRLRIVLSGAPADGGVSMRTSAVTLTVGGVTYRGRVTALDGDQLAASVASTAGAVLALAVAMNVDPTTAAVAGTVGATPRS